MNNLALLALPVLSMALLLLLPRLVSGLFKQRGPRARDESPSAIDEALAANLHYTQNSPQQDLSARPTRRLAVVTCMDVRLQVEHLLGLRPGDAHILRNAGGIVTEDTLRSLLVSHHLLGTREVMIINHTDCGMMRFKDEQLRAQLVRKTGQQAIVPAHFHAFRDLAGNLRRQVWQVRSHPWLPADLVVRGFIYDVKTGRLREIELDSVDRRDSAAETAAEAHSCCCGAIGANPSVTVVSGAGRGAAAIGVKPDAVERRRYQ